MLRFLRCNIDQVTFLLTTLAVVFPVLSIAAASTFLALALLSFWVERALRQQTKIYFPGIRAPLFLFMATTCVALLFSPEPQMGSPPISKFWLFFIILLVSNKFFTDRVIQAYQLLFLLGFVAAALSIVQYFFGSQGSVEARLTGFVGHWMTFSGVLMLVFMSLSGYILFANPSRKLFWFLVLCTIGLSLALTLTRSVWIATTTGLISLLLMKYCHWKTLAASGLTLVLLVVLAPGTLQRRMRSILDPQDPSNYARLAIWKTGIRMIREHPWLGVGPQRVSKVFYDYHFNPDDRYRLGFFPVHMHNNLLQFAAERGIPCALAWLWLILKIAADHWKGFWRPVTDSQNKSIYAIGFISVLVLFVAGLFEFNFGDSEVLMIFLFLVSAPYAIEKAMACR